jgi:cytidyltransferase-like protein
MKIGYAYVVADLLHIGHLKHLEACKSLCDKLIVGVLTDEATMEKKPKPIISFEERLEMVKALKCVNIAIRQDTYSPLSNVEQLNIDILFESVSHTKESIFEAKRLMEKFLKGKLIVMPYYDKQSSTEIKNKIIKEWKNDKS